MEKHAKFPSGKAVLKALKYYRPRGRGQWVDAAKVFVKGFVRPGRKAPVKGIEKSLKALASANAARSRSSWPNLSRRMRAPAARQQLAKSTGTVAGRVVGGTGLAYGGKKGIEYVAPLLVTTPDTTPKPGLTTAADPSKPTLGEYALPVALGGAGAFTLYELVKAIRATVSKSRTGEKVDTRDKEEKSAQAVVATAPAPVAPVAPAPAASPPKMVRTNLGMQELAAPANRGVFIKGRQYSKGNLADLKPERPVYAPAVKPPLAYANSRRPRTNAEWETAYRRGEATPSTRAEYGAQMAAYNRRLAEQRKIDAELRAPTDWDSQTAEQRDNGAKYIKSQLGPAAEGGWVSEKTSAARQYPGWIERIFPRLKQNRLDDEKIKTLERLYPDKYKVKPMVPRYAGKVTAVAPPRVDWTGKLAR